MQTHEGPRGVVSAETFRAWRKLTGLTMERGAAALGIGRRTLAHYQTGNRWDGGSTEIPWHVWLACISIAHGFEREAEQMVERGPPWLADVPKVHRLASLAFTRGLADWTPSDGLPKGVTVEALKAMAAGAPEAVLASD